MIFQTNLVGYARLLQAQGPTLLLGAFAGPLEVGIFKVAMAIASGFGTLYLPAWNAVMPRLSRLWAKRDLEAIRHLIRESTVIAGALLSGVGALVILFGEPLLEAIGGPKAASGEVVLALAIVAQTINGALFWNDSLLYAVGRARVAARGYLVSVIACLPVLAGLASVWGANGAAVAILLSTLMSNTWLTLGAVRFMASAASESPTATEIAAPSGP
jgi:O-antigen/teichoic acid export membrane protein